MKWITGKALLRHARQNGYAVGAFSAHNAETIQAIIAAAEAESAPVMIQVGQRVIRSMGLVPMVRMIEAFAEDTDTVLCVHLDHGNALEQAVLAVKNGFHSVMYDGSHLSLEQNITMTSQVASMAQAAGVSVEGELGRIGGVEDDISVSAEEAFLTDPEEAVRFVDETGIDYLAVAVGTAHGLYKGQPKLHLDRLAVLAERIPIPLVLHGGSGVPDALIREAIARGIAKINVDTELRQAFSLKAQEIWSKDPHQYHLAVVLGEAGAAVQRKVREKIKLFGSGGKSVHFQ